MTQQALLEARRTRLEGQRDDAQREMQRLNGMLVGGGLSPDQIYSVQQAFNIATERYNRLQEQYEKAERDVALSTNTNDLLNDIRTAPGNTLTSANIIGWYNRARGDDIRDSVRERLFSEISIRCREAYQNTPSGNREQFLEDLRDANLPEQIWGTLEKRLSNEQRQDLITEINNLTASNTNTDLRDLATKIQGDADLTQRLSNRIFDIYTSVPPANRDNYVNTRLSGLPDSIANTTREHHEQVFQRQQALATIRGWSPGTLPGVADVTDLYNTIRNINDNQPVLDELRDRLDVLYEQHRAAGAGNTGQPIIDAAQNLPDSLIGELRKKHEKNEAEAEKNDIRTRIQTISGPVAGMHITATFPGGSGGDSIQEIYNDIIASPHNELVGELVDRLEQLYYSFNTADRNTMISNLQTQNIHPEVRGPLEKIHEETQKNELRGDITGFSFAGIPATAAELQTVENLAGRARGEDELLELLRDKIRHYYHTTLTTPDQRHQFVTEARNEGVPEDIIGEYLWKETNERVEEAEDLIEKLEPIMQDHIDPAHGTGSGYFDNTLLPDYLIPAVRSGIPKETVEELRLRFEQACDAEADHREDSPKLHAITKGYTDAIIEQLLPDKIAQDPFADDRSAVIGSLTTGNLVENNRLNYGKLRRNVIATINAEFGGTEVYRRDILAEEVYQNILEDMREHMPDIIEINKLEREADRLRAKSRELRFDHWKEWAKDLLLVGGVGITAVNVYAGVMGIGTGVAFSNIWNFLSNTQGGAVTKAVGLPAMFVGVWERWKQHKDTREKMKKAAADLEGKELEITSRVTSVAEKRGMQLRRRRVHYDGLARSILRPALARGREEFTARHEFLRRQLVGAEAPRLAQFAIA
ncbi:hypothetical protein GF362_01630 [Candidatus Dojkabacteria bacterium]|nr:hypothetical protein [Candidatus Dojkabacteria bacterium]